MTQADCVHSTPPTNTSAITSSSRRGFLAKAAGVAAGSAVLVGASTISVPAIASHGGPDPILAAIEAHKAAMAAVLAELKIHAGLENELPSEKRQSGVSVWEEMIIFDDDPRWINSERAMYRLWGVENDAAVELINVVPTTVEGLITLLQYAVSADADGQMWPCDLQAEGDERKFGASWHHFLIQNVAEILPGMVGRA